MAQAVAARSGVDLTIRRRGPADFFWLADLEHELRTAVDELVTRTVDPISHRDIVIDVTAGSKLPSIAAAVATMTNEMAFSYVEANQVWLLDAHARIGRIG